jgi:ribosome-binding factor A
MPSPRQKRVAELVRHEIAALLQKGVKDPRVGFVSVMDVEMSPDLRYADVYVSLFGDDSEKKGSMAGLKHSAGWIRREIGHRIRLRFTPEVRFFEDTTLDKAYQIEAVIEKIHEENEQDENTPDPG